MKHEIIYEFAAKSRNEPGNVCVYVRVGLRVCKLHTIIFGLLPLIKRLMCSSAVRPCARVNGSRMVVCDVNVDGLARTDLTGCIIPPGSHAYESVWLLVRSLMCSVVQTCFSFKATVLAFGRIIFKCSDSIASGNPATYKSKLFCFCFDRIRSNFIRAKFGV